MEWVLLVVGAVCLAYSIYKRRADKEILKQLLIKAVTVGGLLILLWIVTTMFE